MLSLPPLFWEDTVNSFPVSARQSLPLFGDYCGCQVDHGPDKEELNKQLIFVPKAFLNIAQ